MKYLCNSCKHRDKCRVPCEALRVDLKKQTHAQREITRPVYIIEAQQSDGLTQAEIQAGIAVTHDEIRAALPGLNRLEALILEQHLAGKSNGEIARGLSGRRSVNAVKVAKILHKIRKKTKALETVD
jgi:hypothetical protein